MASNESDIWKGKEFVSIISKCNVPFNRYNLKKYFLSHDFESICAESIIEYFGKDEISKKDEETGCYLSHLLFLDNYNSIAVNKIFENLFDDGYITPYEINDKGQLYIDCLFQSIRDYRTFADKILENAIKKHSINLDDHRDFNGNNIAHWLSVSNYEFRYFVKYFSRFLIYQENKNGISVNDIWNLSVELYFSNYILDKHFNVRETENNLIITTNYPQIGYELYSGNRSRFKYANDLRFEVNERVFNKDEVLLKLLRNKKYYDVYMNNPNGEGKEIPSSDYKTFNK